MLRTQRSCTKNTTTLHVLLCLLCSLQITFTTGIEVLLSAAPNIPPYLLDDNHGGIELDIIKLAFQTQGHKVRTTKINSNTIIVNQNNPTNEKHLYLSDSFISYEDIVISLQSKKLSLTKTQQLTSHSIIAFPTASIVLGNAFNEISIYNPTYQEDHIINQITALYTGATDFILTDKNHFQQTLDILKNKNLIPPINLNLPISEHKLYPTTTYKLATNSKRIRDDFNHGLTTTKSLNTYHQVWQHYIHSQHFIKEQPALE